MLPGANYILLVENNPADEQRTLNALRKNHIANEVVIAHDGVEALDFLHGTGAHAGRDTRMQPELVLLDRNLPRLDGDEVLTRVRGDARTRHVPVVVLTSSQAEEDALHGSNVGAVACVRKPVELAPFSAALKRLGLCWLLLDERWPPASRSR